LAAVPAQYFLLQPHFINDVYLDAWSTVTEGVEVPTGWVPTLMVDPLNTAAVNAFYAAGPRIGYLGPNYGWQGTKFYSGSRLCALQQPVTYWTKAGPGQWKLTGLGTALASKGE